MCIKLIFEDNEKIASVYQDVIAKVVIEIKNRV
jgi:hypothetical protein